MSSHAFILYGNYINPYLRIVRITDGLVFDITNGCLVPAPVWADTALPLGTKNAAINGWPVDLPENLPNGIYDVQLYDSDAPSSENTMIAGWLLVMPYQLLVNPTEFPLDVLGRIRTAHA